MASSPIRINEATVDELQSLKGIGPKRAANIHSYRYEIGPVRNVFDLATAAAISVKEANKLSARIDWHSDTVKPPVNKWPLLLTCLASAWILTISFGHLISFPSNLWDLGYIAGVSSVLTGALIATADIAWTSVRNESSETTLLFRIGSGLCLLGLFGLGCLAMAGSVQIGDETATPLSSTLTYISMVAAILWLLYGPAILLRIFVSRTTTNMENATLIYDLTFVLLLFFGVAMLSLLNSETLIEEIFCVWLIVTTTNNGLELVKGRTAFVSALSNLDKGRYQFYLRHQMNHNIPGDRFKKILGGVVLICTLLLTLALIEELYIFIQL